MSGIAGIIHFDTFWQGILRLMSAYRMEVDALGPQLEQYWAPDFFATLPYTKDQDYIDHFS